MNKFWKEFFFRGLICAGGGPLVLAIIYGILGATGTVETLTPIEAMNELYKLKKMMN